MDKALALKFGKSLRKARNARCISQEALAHEAGLDRTYIGMLERGIRQPSLETLQKLAKALKTPAWKMVRDALGG